MQRIKITCVLLLSGMLCQPGTVAEDRSLTEVRSAIVSVRWNVGSPPGFGMGFPARIYINGQHRNIQIEQNPNYADVPAMQQVLINGTTGDAIGLPQGQQYTKSITHRATGFVNGQQFITVLPSEARSDDSLAIFVADGSEHKPTIIAWDPATGLTVLEVKSDLAGEPTTGLSLAEQPIEWGDAVRVAHEWRTRNPALITGIVSTTPEYDSAVRAATFDIDGLLPKNATGAPVLNAANEVVGIVNGQRSSSGDAGPGIAIQADKIRRLLAFVDAGSKGAMPKPMIGVSLSLTSKGAVVEKVIEDSPASTAGLKIGDLIVSINGQKATRPDEVIAFVDQHMLGDEVKVQIEREGEMQDLSMLLKALQPPEETPKHALSKTFIWNLGGEHPISNLPPGLPEDQRKQIEEALSKLQTDSNAPKAVIVDSGNHEGGSKRVYIAAIPPDVSQQVAELRKDIAEIKELLKSLKKD
ncbi:MAG: S1C family serine protease [Planctomycetota bacterium]|nr:S1C family serine protease [Planctomycetota bacterium]